MATSSVPAAAQTDREVLITRLINAPRELVFKAWTDPELLPNWYAPHGCTLRISQIDVRPGGTFHTCISNPNWGDCWVVGLYQEVVSNERIVMTMAAADQHGKRIDPVAAGHDPDWPAETVVTITFTDQAGQTLVTLHQTVSETLAQKTGAHGGWIQMLERLETLVQQAR